MRMFTLEVDFLAEDDQHAAYIMGRITESLSKEQTVLSVGGLTDITQHATDHDRLTDEEADQLLRQRDTYFINRIRHLLGGVR